MMPDPSRPVSTDEPLTVSELRLRRTRRPAATVAIQDEYARASTAGTPTGETCRCGSRRVYRVADPENEYRVWKRCFVCWRKWQ